MIDGPTALVKEERFLPLTRGFSLCGHRGEILTWVLQDSFKDGQFGHMHCMFTSLFVIQTDFLHSPWQRGACPPAPRKRDLLSSPQEARHLSQKTRPCLTKDN